MYRIEKKSGSFETFIFLMLINYHIIERKSLLLVLSKGQ